MKQETKEFLSWYLDEFARLEQAANRASWQAANSGRKEDFDASAAAALALRTFHSNREKYEQVRRLRAAAESLAPLENRSLELAELAYRRNQVAPELLRQMVQLSSEIERQFNTFRGQIGEQRYSNNDLLEMLRTERDSGQRQRIWEALKQVGQVVAPQLIQLAGLRNQAARQLGFANFWDMEIRLQEHDPEQLLTLFEELEQSTRESFTRMKRQLDEELAARFQVPVEQLMPWHYDNPFFQAAPPSARVDLDVFYDARQKEDIVELARQFYAGIGLPVEDILRRSDLYEREGKDQHAFCVSVDRAGDVRTLCNIKPTAEWMDTLLHELGHGVYDLHIDRGLLYNVREPAQAFTTEGVAMFFGALAKSPVWLVSDAGASAEDVARLATAIREQRRREQLIFARWTMVMLHFEKAFYENPGRPLNALWWDTVARYQQLSRPAGRDAADWAAKPHFTIAPVYYHSYMLGELFAAQLRHALATQVPQLTATGGLQLSLRPEVGMFLRERVFRPGSRWNWIELVRNATGEPLTARCFASEVE